METKAYTDILTEKRLVDALAGKGLVFSCAESCTGGLVAKRITDIAGSSQVFSGGVVTYSNEMKTKLLGVKEETLETHGAVSHETACEMVRGLAALSGADVCVSLTGIAGPDGGTDEKPVGLVYVGLWFKGETRTYKLLLGKHVTRERIRSAAAEFALKKVLEFTESTN